MGKTSDASTQLTGPKERAKTMDVRKITAIPARCADRFCVSPGGKDETMAVRMENVQTNVAEPKRRGRFLPTRSSRRVMKLGQEY